MSKEKWTTANMPDLSGKVMIVTGGNSGLGYESVKAFAEKGARVVMASRSIEKGEAARAEMGASEDQVEVITLDLMDFASIRKFAEEVNQKYDRLDVLLNNAGIMTTPYFLTKDGLEAQNGTNHFGHFALTGQLLDLIKKTPDSRVVNVSSAAHKMGKMDFDNLLFEGGKDYTPIKSYGRSKLANLLFAYELDRQFRNHGIDSISLASHPGVSQTNLSRFLEKKWWFKILTPIFLMISQKQDMGALPQIRASVDPAAQGSQYYGPHKNTTGYPVIEQSNEASHNEADAKRLWDISTELTGVTYNF